LEASPSNHKAWARASSLKNDLGACILLNMVPVPIIGLEHSGLSAKYAILTDGHRPSTSLQEILFMSILINNKIKRRVPKSNRKKGVQQV
jgi:hypothetical protein